MTHREFDSTGRIHGAFASAAFVRLILATSLVAACSDATGEADDANGETMAATTDDTLGSTVRMEAESMALTTFVVQSDFGGGYASGGNLIRLPANGSGSASKAFAGATGTYDVAITYFDESDGASRYALQIGGVQRGTWTGALVSSDAALAQPSLKTRKTKVIAGQSVKNGDRVVLTGVAQGGEYARVDYIDFVLRSGVAPPPPVTPPPPPPSSTCGTLPVAPPISCSGVAVPAGTTGAALQSLVRSKPAGTTFCVPPGTYTLGGYIMLKDSQRLICTTRRTCTLTGLDKNAGGVQTEYGATRTLVRGFIVERFSSGYALSSRDLGVIEDNEVRYNATGIDIGNGAVTIRYNKVHANHVYGISGGPAAGTLIESNEVANNNTDHLDPNHDAGGSKIVGSSAGQLGLTWRGNYVHDNYGNSIWSDGNVRNAVYENNCVVNNGGAGINHEISFSAVIRNNTLRGNGGLDRGSCFHSGAIVLNNSQGVEIVGNAIEGQGTNGICLVDAVRVEGSAFPQYLSNINVHDNTIRMHAQSYTGAVGTKARSIVFAKNTYHLDNLTALHWQFFGPEIGKTAWIGAGHDATGSFAVAP